MTTQIKAVYFDLDDTLCAYWDASRKALRQAIDEANLPVATDDVVEAWRGVFPSFSKEIKTDRWYQHYLESGEVTRTEHIKRTLRLIGLDEGELADRISSRYAELRNSFLSLFPDAMPVLEVLQARFRLGLITNGPADVQRQEIDTLKIAHFFDQVLIEGEFKAGKPSPEIFDAARLFSECAADEMLFVGNAYEHDVQGAKRAGWRAIWLNRAAEEDPRTEPRPDAIISNLYELCDWLAVPRPRNAPPVGPVEIRQPR